MAPELSQNLIAFHALSSCDNMSFIAGNSKKTMCGEYLKTPWVALWSGRWRPNTRHAFNIPDDFHTTNEARFMQFFLVKKTEALPPTSDALKLHKTRTHYQSKVWKQANCSQPHLPSPTDIDWKYEDGRHIPIWCHFNQFQKVTWNLSVVRAKLVVRHCAVLVVNPKYIALNHAEILPIMCHSWTSLTLTGH